MGSRQDFFGEMMLRANTVVINHVGEYKDARCFSIYLKYLYCSAN